MFCNAVVAHAGYQDGEIPVYRDCALGCGTVLRADRLDLVDEHVLAHHTRPRRPRRCALTELQPKLIAVLDEQPLAAILEYVCRRLNLHRGDREVQVRFRDGRYQRTHVWDGDRGVRTRLGR